MRIVVLKYGGSTVATIDNLRAVARQVIRCKASGEDPVVVVSAMGQTTDHFLDLAYQITKNPTARELDMLLSVGERISISLLAMAINAEGPYEAVSLTGSQVGIITDTQHTRAKIVEIRCGRIYQTLEKGQIPIVAGFQGVSVEKEITTLGRGGSDTTAVALAAALGAEQCRIMKDVDGVYSADPDEVPQAKIIDRLSYQEMLEFSATGSRVLATDSVSLAEEHGMNIAIGQARTGAIGTIITSQDFSRSGVRGLVSIRNLVAIQLGSRTDLDPALQDLHVGGWAIRGLFSEGTRQVLLLERIPQGNTPSLDQLTPATKWGKRIHRYRQSYARISVIGAGLEPGGEHFRRIHALLDECRVVPRWFCCSPARVSFCIPDRAAQRTLTHLHRNLIESST